MKADALNSTNVAALRTYTAARSAKDALAWIKTPTLVFQGRRDFAFGLEQGIRAYRQLGGPKRTLLASGKKRWRLSFPLIQDIALIARGSKLRLTLSWTSTAQHPANLLYLTGVPDASSLTLASATVKLRVLRKPISG